ncbi:hypothetical protein B0T20DRAFT_497612, partial [Sordaria brevicollis]
KNCLLRPYLATVGRRVSPQPHRGDHQVRLNREETSPLQVARLSLGPSYQEAAISLPSTTKSHASQALTTYAIDQSTSSGASLSLGPSDPETINIPFQIDQPHDHHKMGANNNQPHQGWGGTTPLATRPNIPPPNFPSSPPDAKFWAVVIDEAQFTQNMSTNAFRTIRLLPTLTRLVLLASIIGDETATALDLARDESFVPSFKPGNPDSIVHGRASATEASSLTTGPKVVRTRRRSPPELLSTRMISPTIKEVITRTVTTEKVRTSWIFMRIDQWGRETKRVEQEERVTRTVEVLRTLRNRPTSPDRSRKPECPTFPRRFHRKHREQRELRQHFNHHFAVCRSSLRAAEFPSRDSDSTPAIRQTPRQRTQPFLPVLAHGAR